MTKGMCMSQLSSFLRKITYLPFTGMCSSRTMETFYSAFLNYKITNLHFKIFDNIYVLFQNRVWLGLMHFLKSQWQHTSTAVVWGKKVHIWVKTTAMRGLCLSSSVSYLWDRVTRLSKLEKYLKLKLFSIISIWSVQNVMEDCQTRHGYWLILFKCGSFITKQYKMILDIYIDLKYIYSWTENIGAGFF